MSLTSSQEIGLDSVKLLVQLKLHESVPNNFEFCDAHVCFNYGSIASIESKPSAGTVAGE